MSGLPLAAESKATAEARGMRANAKFEYRDISVDYSELPDAETNLLFGNCLWPSAEVMAKLLIDAARGGAKIWTQHAAMQLGVPLEMLLQRRFGLDRQPTVLNSADRLRLADGAVIPDVSSSHVLEVGSGVGLTGLVCHALGAAVVLSDGEQRLVDALAERHSALAAESDGRLRCALLDWHKDVLESDPVGGPHETFELILGCEVLHPSCQGEIHVPRLIGRRLAREPMSRALLLSEVRGEATACTAVHELKAQGLAVFAYQVYALRRTHLRSRVARCRRVCHSADVRAPCVAFTIDRRS
jgi:hypothetical protein